MTFEISIPPNALTGSASNAKTYASSILGLVAIPQALLCFKIANVGPSFLNSSIRATAASTSNKLLYESSFPCNLSNTVFKSP